MKWMAILGVVFLTCSCQKAHEKTIDQYIQDNFSDPDSYERVSLGEPEQYTPLTMFLESLDVPGDSVAPAIRRFRSQMEQSGSDPDMVLFRYVDHSYRAKNEYGAKILHKERWFLNEDLTTVIRIEPK